MSGSELIHFSVEVDAARTANQPLVALESTVIAHGLPRPENLTTAHELEQIVKTAGALPATIAVIEGKLCVGLTPDQVELIAAQEEIQKLSIRDLPIAVAKKLNGATTVASTLWIARRAGIRVFATGGIGGVHRGQLPDVSADLPQLAATPMIVVCSGAKIVLDLPATREWLETYGVTVVGYQCENMPAFYSRQSDLKVDAVATDAKEVVTIYNAQRALGLNSALLVTVPVPVEAEIPASELQRVLDEAVTEAERLSIGGRQLTPFLLARMAESSGGATLRANISLLKNNARIAADIAVAMGH